MDQVVKQAPVQVHPGQANLALQVAFLQANPLQEIQEVHQDLAVPQREGWGEEFPESISKEAGDSFWTILASLLIRFSPKVKKSHNQKLGWIVLYEHKGKSKKIFGLEIKSGEIKRSVIKPLEKFVSKFNLNKSNAKIISFDYKDKVEDFEIIPFYEFLLS